MDEDQRSSWVTRAKFSHGRRHCRTGSLDLSDVGGSELSNSVSKSKGQVNSSFRAAGDAGFTFWQDEAGGKVKSVCLDSELGSMDGRVAVPMVPRPKKSAGEFGSDRKGYGSESSDGLSVDFEFDPKKVLSDSIGSGSTSGSGSPLPSHVVSVYSRKFSGDVNSMKSGVFSDRKGRDSKPKERAKSPVPAVIISDAFREARSASKRFSSPQPRRKGSDRNRESTNTYRDLSPMKPREKLKNKKDKVWLKYFDYGGGKVIALETTEKWNVNLSELYIGHRFACGAHSKLYKGIYNEKPVAVKIIRQPDDDENGEMAATLEKQFIREVTILSHLYHPNVIKLAGACKDPPVFCIITEYISGGSLRAFLHKLDHKPLPLTKLICFALDIARGMEYIHSHGIIHRDLKPENILLDQDSCLKIVDFGVACEEAYCDVLADDAGTYRWMAPEMIKHKPYGRKVDVYSFGLLLWEMATGTVPYEDMTPIQAAYAVVNRKTKLHIPDGCPASLRTLIEQCWSIHPEKRPEFWEIVKTLEQLKSALVRDGTLDKCQIFLCHDKKKRLMNWAQKLKLPNLEFQGA